MQDLKILKETELQFAKFQNHSRFLIRERLYNGTGAFNPALKMVHDKLIDLIDKTEKFPTPSIYLQVNSNEFWKFTENLNKTLNMLMFIAERDNIDPMELVKIVLIVDMELGNLADFLSKGQHFDPSTIQSENDLSTLRIDDLKLKIEDNLTQLTLSTEWRKLKSQFIDKRVSIEELTLLIEESKKLSSEVNTQEDLVVLSILATNIRDIAAKNIISMKNSLHLFISFSSILKEKMIFESNGVKITSKDVKDDIELKINLKQLNWVIDLHNSIRDKNGGDKYIEKFAKMLYKLSRDKKEEFKWNMTRLIQEKKNLQLNEISNAYIKMLAILVNVNGTVKERGLTDLYLSILQASEIEPIDTIDVSSDLLMSEEDQIARMINAIRNRLEGLKKLAYQIIQMDDIKPSFQMIVQFTDQESQIESGRSLEEYIRTLGNNNKISAWN